MAEDPCDAYECQIDMVPSVFCNTTFKGPYDLNCFIPCMISNCSVELSQADLCPFYECSEIVTTTTIPTTPTPENGHLVLELSFGIPGDFFS